jgi:hypothetical protein
MGRTAIGERDCVLRVESLKNESGDAAGLGWIPTLTAEAKGRATQARRTWACIRGIHSQHIRVDRNKQKDPFSGGIEQLARHKATTAIMDSDEGRFNENGAIK